MQLIDAINILRKIDKTFFTTADLQKILKLKRSSLKKSIKRLTKKGLLKRLGRNIYIVPDKGLDLKSIVSQLYAPYAYISFESALSTYGIINQIPYSVTMATCRLTKARPFLQGEIILRRIKKQLFFGYKLADKTLIAEPEKALLDTLYLKSKGLTGLNEEELNLGDLSKSRFLEMSKKFPANVQRDARRLAKRMKKSSVITKSRCHIFSK